MANPNASSFQESAADVIAIIVLFIVPIIAIAVFWLVHIIPEKVAEKRHHPQKEAIKTLCLLSLVFGGLLWPLAWLWAYSKPVLHKLAYGSDKHEDFYIEHAGGVDTAVVADTRVPLLQDPAALQAEIDSMRLQLQTLASQGTPPTDVTRLSQRLDAMQRALDEQLLQEARH